VATVRDHRDPSHEAGQVRLSGFFMAICPERRPLTQSIGNCQITTTILVATATRIVAGIRCADAESRQTMAVWATLQDGTATGWNRSAMGTRDHVAGHKMVASGRLIRLFSAPA